MSSSLTIVIMVYLVLAIFIALIVFLVVWLVRKYRRAQNMHPKFCESLGENLKKYREACGMSRETVAKVLDMSNRKSPVGEMGR